MKLTLLLLVAMCFLASAQNPLLRGEKSAAIVEVADEKKRLLSVDHGTESHSSKGGSGSGDSGHSGGSGHSVKGSKGSGHSGGSGHSVKGSKGSKGERDKLLFPLSSSDALFFHSFLCCSPVNVTHLLFLSNIKGSKSSKGSKSHKGSDHSGHSDHSKSTKS